MLDDQHPGLYIMVLIGGYLHDKQHSEKHQYHQILQGRALLSGKRLSRR